MSEACWEAAQRLADILSRENEVLKRVDYVAAVALVPDKEAALADLTKSVTPTIKLGTLGQRLVELAAENQVLLERAIEVQTRVVRIVARAAAPPPGKTHYNGRGARVPSARSAALALSTGA
ncbi:MAG TPA: hypothetical protein VHU42_09005 [Rhodopila sp.]|jgi:hypothetical protein|nr:hypothetical protein [Rhodopila sp.]